jgi:hypothetical protein
MEFTATIPLDAHHDSDGEVLLSMPILVHADTGQLLLPVRLGTGRCGTLKADFYVGQIPIPIRCAHHGRWHALPNAAVQASHLPLPVPHALEDPLGILGTILALATAPSCTSASRHASAFRAAWRKLSRKLLPSGAARKNPNAALKAHLDRLTLLPRALADSGINIQEALSALASAHLPGESHPIWLSLRTGTTILPHKCPAFQDWHAAGRVAVPRLHSTDLFIATRDACAALAAEISATCEEATRRLCVASRHLQRSTPEYPFDYVYITYCQQAARALRAVLLPPADFALEALKDA